MYQEIHLRFFFFQYAETILLFHFPHNKQDEKEGQRQGRGLKLTIWEAFTLVKDLEPDRNNNNNNNNLLIYNCEKDDQPQLSRYLKLLTKANYRFLATAMLNLAMLYKYMF